jgi:hypothetical protein
MRLTRRPVILGSLIAAIVFAVIVVSVTVYFNMPVRSFCANDEPNERARLSVDCSAPHLWEVYGSRNPATPILFCWVGSGPAPPGPIVWQYGGGSQQVKYTVGCPTFLDLFRSPDRALAATPRYLYAFTIQNQSALVIVLILAVVGLTIGLASLALFVKRRQH